MPLILEPIREIKEASAPVIDKVENSTIDGAGLVWVFLLFIVLYLFRNPIFYFLTFLFKMTLLLLFSYTTYILI
jgi:hypothetical protein